MNIAAKTVFSVLLSASLAGTVSQGFAQNMEGTYAGTAVITGYDSNGKKTKESMVVSAGIDASNNFGFEGGVLSYDGTLVTRGKECAVIARKGDNNYTFRGKLKPGKSVSGTLYWVSPTDFRDVKIKLKRVIIK